MLSLISIILLAVYANSASSVELCSLKDPDASKCFSKALKDVLPSLVKGVPKLGIFSIDPLHMELLDLSDKPGKLLNVRHKFHEVDMTGIGSVNIKNVRLDLDKTELDIDVEFTVPSTLTGTYESQGKILTLPIKGDGPFNITLIGVKAALKMKGHQETKNGKTHIKIDKARFPFAADRMIVDFKDLLKGNKEISTTINNVLNENWRPVLDDMKDSFGDGIAAALQEIANRAFNKLPINELIKV